MWEVNCHLGVIFGLVGMTYFSCISSYLLCKCLQRQSAYTGVYVCFCRWPRIMPILEPEYACRKIVDAVRREQVYVYMPRSIYIAIVLKK